jgi:hypothetical protein
MSSHLPDQKPEKHSGKKAYRSPCLVDYGDIRSLTAQKGATKGDSAPNTKTRA